MGVIAKQSVRGAVANYLGVIIGFVTTFFVLTHYLTTEEVGLTRVLVDAAMLFSGIAQLGTNASILKFYHYFKDPDHGDHGFFGWTLILPLVGFGLFTIVFFLGKDIIIGQYVKSSPLFVDYFYLLLPLTFFALYTTVFETNASVLQRIAVPKFVREVGIRLFNLVFYLLYGYHLISIDLFVVLFCSSYALAALLNFFYLLSLGKVSFRLDFSFVSKRLQKDILIYTLFMTATVLAGNVKLFNSIVLAKDGLALAGIYTVASYIANVIEIPYRSLGAISGPFISAAVKEDNFPEVNRLGQQVSLHQMLVSSLLLFFIWINLSPLFGFIPNGAEYSSGLYVVLFLGFANMINSSFSIGTNILNFSKYYAFSLLFIAVLTVSAVWLNLTLIPLWGVSGSACATLFAYVLYFSLLLTFLWRKLGVSLFCVKQLYVSFLALALFALNYLWDLALSPIFGDGLLSQLVQVVLRNIVFFVLAVGAVSRMHVSSEVDKLLSKLHLAKR